VETQNIEDGLCSDGSSQTSMGSDFNVNNVKGIVRQNTALGHPLGGKMHKLRIWSYI
jgi:hypothetical protein